jgi:toxin-antitoxin system PIN domain toxin
VIAVDTNVLVHAHREGLAHQGRALLWLRTLAEGRVPWGLPVFCLGEFVRVVTHPRVLDPPSTVSQAVAALEGLLESPTLRVLSPGPRYAELFFDAVRQADARGNLSFDAQIFAVCRERGASRLLTLDRDFARFPGIRIVTLDVEPVG